MNYIIGLDNGVGATGIALLGPNNLVKYEKLPTKSELNYQKEEQHITRLDVPAFRKLLLNWNLPIADTIVIMERIMINPTRFKASISAARCFEATLIILEEFNLNYDIIDSKQWQHILLPNIEGSTELKKASLELGKKLFPGLKLHKDADSLLIAYWAMNKSASDVKTNIK
jgi:hypothetical protein